MIDPVDRHHICELTAISMRLRNRMLLACIVASLFVCGCTRSEQDLSIESAEYYSSGTLVLVVSSCDRSPVVSDLIEGEESIEILVSPSAPEGSDGGLDCLDVVDLKLNEPLGDRDVVDSSTGHIVPVEMIDAEG